MPDESTTTEFVVGLGAAVCACTQNTANNKARDMMIFFMMLMRLRGNTRYSIVGNYTRYVTCTLALIISVKWVMIKSVHPPSE